MRPRSAAGRSSWLDRPDVRHPVGHRQAPHALDVDEKIARQRDAEALIVELETAKTQGERIGWIFVELEPGEPGEVET